MSCSKASAGKRRRNPQDNNAKPSASNAMPIPILMYHQIDIPPGRGTPLRGLVVSPDSFGRQMGLLALFGYRGVSMEDLLPYLSGEKIGKVVGITFDDGFQNNLYNALPVLLRYGFTATCYGVSNMLGGSNSWDEKLGIPQKILMTVSEWRAWSDAGMDVGSHTRHHAALTKIGTEEALLEISRSKQELEQTIGCSVSHFCYPYGWFNLEHKEMVRDAGYLTATTTRRGRVHSQHDTFELNRIMVSRTTYLGQFAAKCFTSYEDLRR